MSSGTLVAALGGGRCLEPSPLFLKIEGGPEDLLRILSAMLQHQEFRAARTTEDILAWIRGDITDMRAGSRTVKLKSADQTREKPVSSWPESVKELAGAWPDFPTAEEIRSGLGEDVPREPL